MQKNPRLFYSRRCRFSADVMQAIELLQKKDLFTYACIEEMPRASLPPELRDVPSMWDPDSQRFYTGKDQVLEFIARSSLNSRRQTPIVSGGQAGGTGANYNVDMLEGPDGPAIGGLLDEPDAPLINTTGAYVTNKDPEELNAKLLAMKAEMQDDFKLNMR